MEWLLWIAMGVAAGLVAQWIMPGPNAGGFAAAIPLGIGGAVLGGAAGLFLGPAEVGFDVRGLLTAMFGAILALFLYRSYAMRLDT